MYRNIFISIYVAIVIGLATLSILIAKEKDKESEKYKRMQIGQYVLISVLGVATIFLVFYFTRVYSKEKRLATRIKNIMSLSKTKENERKFDKLCDKLFKTRPALYSQFNEMKKTRSGQEVRTLCGNHAKNILGIKV